MPSEPQFVSSLNGKVLNMVIDFDFIINTDVGLIRFIQENFQDDRVFQLDKLNKSDRELLSLLYSRKNWNPLSIFSTEENLSEIDELYKSFFDNYKKDIINKSISLPEINKFIHLINSSGRPFGISSYVAVSDELEANTITSQCSNLCIIPKRKSSLIDKDPFYVKDYKFFIDCNMEDLSHRKIYILPYQYSLDYLKDTANRLTIENIFVFTGDDYRLKENHEQ